MKHIFPVLGIMVCLYVAALLLGKVNKKLEAERKYPFLQTVIAVVSVAFLYLSAPVGLVLFFVCPPSNN